MISSFSNSFFSVFTSVLTLFKTELRRYVIMPLMINIALFSVTIYYVTSQFSSWMDSILPSWLDWLNWLIIPLFTVTILIVVFYSFTIVANIIAAPFNSLLAEKYEQLLRGETDKQNHETTAQLISRTIAAEFKKISYILLWLIPLLIATFIPVINLISPFLWVLFAVWMLSLEYLDYPMGNNNLRFPEVKQTAHRQKAMTLGLGSGLFILTTIPFINFIAIPAGVIAATKVYIDHTDKKA
ncbi:MAG: sulfate transporter CysZ [Gammaproteobacteria bacterium]|nr:sulfate transporter CysZ [Gammaproteobacteria bacterium]